MSLSSLRPTQPTDLVSLSALLRGLNAHETALPASLPESLLLSVARDLRSIEQSAGTDDEGEDPGTSLSAPMALVICLLFSGNKRPQRSTELTISESALLACLRTYQWAVEREIVARITGIGGKDDEETLLASLAQSAAC